MIFQQFYEIDKLRIFSLKKIKILILKNDIQILDKFGRKFMSIKMVPSVIVSIFFGFLLGSIPFLNEYLHWNIWYIIPISGFIFGALVGFLQFWMCFPVNQKAIGWSMFIFSCVGVVSYIAVDYGIYKSLDIEMPFMEAFRIAFKSFGDKLSYFVDLLGAFIGNLGCLYVWTEKYPFCDQCKIYKKRESKYEILILETEALLSDILRRINEYIIQDNLSELISYIKELDVFHNNATANKRIIVDHRYCPKCNAVTIIGTVSKREDNDWSEVDNLNFGYPYKAPEDE